MSVSVKVWMARARLAMHLLGAGLLVTVMWEQSGAEAALQQSTSSYLSLVARDLCSS
jgi:hypothetical protein